jgi:hypothetical protein
MGAASGHRSSNRERERRQPVPASIAELAAALKRLWTEAATLAEHAYIAIQRHSYEPYWTFRAKIEEHAALVAVLRGRIATLRELRVKGVDELAQSIDREEQEIVMLTVKACLKFCFALSANPWLPIGARETFIHEIDALQQSRQLLEKAPAESLPAGFLDDIDTARMILEEVIEKSPSLDDFDRLGAAADEAAGDAAAHNPPEQAQTPPPEARGLTPA